MPHEDIVLYTTLDSAAAVTTPAVGPSGTYAHAVFRTYETGRVGLDARSYQKYVRFDGNAISRDAGAVEFDYAPALPDTDSRTRDLCALVSQGTRTPLLAVTLTGRQLTLFILDPVAGQRETVGTVALTLNRRAHLRFEWDRTHATDSLRMFVNGVRVGAMVPGGWTMRAGNDLMMYIGCRDDVEVLSAEGTIDEFRVMNVVADPVITYPNDASPLGTNLEYLRYWANHWMYKDAFKYAGIYVSGTIVGWASRSATVWNDGRAVALNAQGWPTSLLANQIAYTQFPSLSGGQMVVLYDGVGALTIGGAAEVSRQMGRIFVSAAPNTLLTAHIASTADGNPVRNIRVLPVAFETDYATAPYHPEFLSRMNRFGVLRFKDLQSTDTQTTQVEWADRAPPDAMCQSSDQKGVAVELLCDLANAVHADAWFCVPHRASDDYVRQMATAIRDRLAPGLRCFLEYSNEVWNGVYASNTYCRDGGLVLGLSTDPNTARLRFQAQRSSALMDIARSVLGTRLVAVLAGMHGVDGVNRELMSWQSAAAHHNVFACGPYFNPGQSPQWEADAVRNGTDWVLDQLRDVVVPAANTRTLATVQLARQFSLPVVAYEAGQHMTTGNRANTALVDVYLAANRSPRMAEVYAPYLAAWRAAGGHEFVHFSFVGPYGSGGTFPIFESQTQAPETAPKYRALMDFITANRKWW